MTNHAAPLRADAERNRQAILCAASEVFSQAGIGSPLEEIARKAGVGIGTLYRRFPERSDLITAVFEAKMTQYAQRCEAASERALTEPWQAFADHVYTLVEAQINDPGFSDVLLAPMGCSPGFAIQHQRAFDATTLLVHRITSAGVVRPEFTHSDLYLLTLATAGIRHAPRSTRNDAAHRLAAYMLEGFRTNSESPLPPPPPAWTHAEPASTKTGR